MPYEGLYPYIDRSDLGAYLRRDLTDDDLALIAIDSACTMIRNLASQRLDLVEDETILTNGEGTDVILLPELPIVSVSSVERDDVEVDSDDYLVAGKSGRLVKKSGVWRSGKGNYSVTYTHGFSEIPSDLRVVTLQLAARIYDQGLAKAEQVGNYQITYAAPEPMGLSPRELSIVAKYRPMRSTDSYDVS